MPDLVGTPASVQPSTGMMYISAAWWTNAPFEERLYVLLHECGHLETQSKSEFDADKWAFSQYASEGHSLRGAINAMNAILPYTTLEQKQRSTALLYQALEFDSSYKG
jgi:hypothetical protein